MNETSFPKKLREDLLSNGFGKTFFQNERNTNELSLELQETHEYFDFDDRDEKLQRNFGINETQGYLDPSQYEATSSQKEISQDNVGFKMLQKMGWKKGKGLGKEGKGIQAPVQLANNETGDTLGLGKATEYNEKIDTVAKQRKLLEVEIQETEDMVEKRLAKAEQQEAIKLDVKDMNKEFYCDSCSKQYKNVAEMSNHLSSYDHHHRKRFKEMQHAERARMGDGDEGARKKRKECEREEKELQRRMQAAQSNSQAPQQPAVVIQPKIQEQNQKPNSKLSFSIGNSKIVLGQKKSSQGNETKGLVSFSFKK